MQIWDEASACKGDLKGDGYRQGLSESPEAFETPVRSENRPRQLKRNLFILDIGAHMAHCCNSETHQK